MCVLLLPIFCLLLSCMSPHYSQSYSHTTSFIFHEANKYQRDATRMKQQRGEWKDEDISLTLLRYWIEPCLKSTFSLGFAIKTNYFSFFIIFFLSTTLISSHIFYKSGSWSIGTAMSLFLTISQRLSEKCYSQKLMPHLNYLDRDLNPIPGSTKR